MGSKKYDLLSKVGQVAIQANDLSEEFVEAPVIFDKTTEKLTEAMRSLFASADKEQFDDEMANFIIRGTDVDDIINTFNFGDELSKDTLKKSFILVKEAFNVTEAKASEILKPEVLEELDMDMEETDKLITALEQSILELAGEFFSLNPVKLEKFEDDFIDTDKTGNEVATAYEKYFI